MYYAILCEDVTDSLALRQQARPAHLDRIGELVTAGRLLAAARSRGTDGRAGVTSAKS